MNWVVDEDGRSFEWPFCVIPGCPNRICLAKGETRFCWPHSSSGLSLEQMIARIDRQEWALPGMSPSDVLLVPKAKQGLRT